MPSKVYAIEYRQGSDREIIGSAYTSMTDALDSLSVGLNFMKEHELYLIEADFESKSFRIYDYMGIRRLRQENTYT